MRCRLCVHLQHVCRFAADKATVAQATAGVVDNKWMTPKTTKAVLDSKKMLVKLGIGQRLGPATYSENALKYGSENNRQNVPMYYSRAIYDENSDTLAYVDCPSGTDTTYRLKKIKNFTTANEDPTNLCSKRDFYEGIKTLGLSLVRPIQANYTESWILIGYLSRAYLIDLLNDKYEQLSVKNTPSPSSTSSQYEVYSNMAFATL